MANPADIPIKLTELLQVYLIFPAADISIRLGVFKTDFGFYLAAFS